MEIYSEHFQRFHGAKGFLQGGLFLCRTALSDADFLLIYQNIIIAAAGQSISPRKLRSKAFAALVALIYFSYLVNGILCAIIVVYYLLNNYPIPSVLIDKPFYTVHNVFRYLILH